MINGVLTAYGRLQSFIVTLAALTAVRGVALLITQGYSTPIESSFLLPLGNGKFLGLYTPTWMAIVMVIVAWYVFTGTMFELEVITAVVLGGTSLMGGRGSILGSAIGALTLGIISNGLVLLRVDVYWVPIVQGSILIVAILLNSKLFARLVRSQR